jgi:hypothetical protein
VAPVNNTGGMALRWWGTGGAGLGAQRYVAVQQAWCLVSSSDACFPWARKNGHGRAKAPPGLSLTGASRAQLPYSVCRAWMKTSQSLFP